MFKLNKLIFAGGLGLAAVALTGGASLAAVACNADNDCWHSREAYNYPTEGHVVSQPDNWMFQAGEPYRWHEHEGRGYWSRGEWRTF